MKKAKLLIAAMFMAVSLGLPAKAVFAASISLAQADFTAACTTPDVETEKGITCSTTDNTYALAAGDYTISEDITLDDDYGILLESGDYTIDLGGHTITANTAYPVIYAEGDNIVLSDGAIVNTNTYSAAGNFGTNVTISNVDFTANGASAVYYGGTDSTTLTIAGGSFTSTGDNGLEIYGGNLVIFDGTFTGLAAGLFLSTGYASVTLSGGTYTYTDTSDGLGAIAIFGTDDVTELTSFLADGYYYQDGTSASGLYAGRVEYVYLTNTTDAVVTDTDDDDDSTDSTTDSTTTETSTTIGTPDSGKSTKETSATVSVLASLLASSAILGGIYVGKKALARK